MMDDSVARALIVEDDSAHAVLIEEAIRSIGLDAVRAPTGRSACQALASGAFAVVIVDVGLPDMSGFDLHEWLSARPDAPSVVFVTADNDVDHAVTAMRRGATHYIVKKRNYLRELEDCVRGLVGASERVERPRRRIEEQMIGRSSAIVGVRRKILEFSRAAGPVVIQGETGTGKSLAARLLHELRFPDTRPYIALDCVASLPGLAGGSGSHGPDGAPWFVSAARQGTLLLEEVGEMPLDQQAGLLRVLDEAEGDGPRVLITSKHDLEMKAAIGELRADLYHRLNGLRLSIPPLRDRRVDIAPLACHFVTRFGPPGIRVSIARQGMAQLLAAEWLGNVRELERVIQRTLAGWAGSTIFHFDLGRSPFVGAPERGDKRPDELRALALHHKGRLGPVAAVLGLSKRTVQRRLAELGIKARDLRRGTAGQD